MKLVREYINEKFTSDSDPIRDMGIGINHIRNFKDLHEIANFIINIIPYILHTEKIPEDIIKDRTHLFNVKYIKPIDDYIYSYIKLNNKHISGFQDYQIFEIMMKKLMKLKYDKGVQDNH